MSATRTDEIWDGRSGYIDEMYIRHYVRVFRVRTDTITDGPSIARTLGIPALGSWWTDGTQVDVGARLQKISPEQDQDDPRLWLVRCEYTSAPPDGTSRDPALWTQDPTTRPPEVEWSFEAYKKVVITDQDGRAVLNSAGDPFDPPVERDDHRLIIKIEWRSFTFDARQALSVQDAVNTDSYLGLDPGQMKIRVFGGKLMYETGVVFFLRTFEAEVRLEGFSYKVLDAGYQVLTNDVDGERRVAKDDQGQPFSSPALLDGFGNLLITGNAPVYLTYRIYPGVVFGSLGIPAIS